MNRMDLFLRETETPTGFDRLGALGLFRFLSA